MLGPIDFVAIGFNGNKFDGSILTELAKAVESKTIRVVDLLFILKDVDGSVLATEVADQSEDLQALVQSLGMEQDMPLLTEEDVEKIAESMPMDTSAGVLIIEQLWAKGLKKALIDAGGMLVAEGRIHPETAEAATEELALTV